ncbi:MAG: cupin domain-containing protein [Bacteroidia bacterium]|nr:cupin domain-containing protein [Bacteroidia bacterium]
MNSLTFQHSTIFDLSGSVDYSDGSVVSKTITKKTTGNLSLFAFDKGQGLSEHSAPFDAIIQILDGNAEISIDRKLYKLNAGQFIIMPANVPHSVFANERFKMLLIMIKGE